MSKTTAQEALDELFAEWLVNEKRETIDLSIGGKFIKHKETVFKALEFQIKHKPLLDRIEKGELVVVPVEPTQAQWGGIARKIVMSRDLGMNKHDLLKNYLIGHGIDIPKWLATDIESGLNISKGDICVWVYKAMIEAGKVDV